MRSFITVLTLILILLGIVIAQEDNKKVSTAGLNPSEIAGHQLFALKKCTDCHTLGDKKEGEMTPIPNMRDADWFSAHIKENSEIVLRQEKSARRQRRVLKDEVKALANFLYGAKDTTRARIMALPKPIVAGAYLVYQQNCLNCHQIGSEGKDAAPVLENIPRRFDREWLMANLEDPKQFNEDTIMPPFSHLSEEERGRIADYLLAID